MSIPAQEAGRGDPAARAAGAGQTETVRAEVTRLPAELIGRVARAERPVAVEGQVVGRASDGTVRLQTPQGEIRLRAEGELPAGRRVSVQIPPQPGLTEARLARAPVSGAIVSLPAGKAGGAAAPQPDGRAVTVTLSSEAAVRQGRAAPPPVPAEASSKPEAPPPRPEPQSRPDAAPQRSARPEPPPPPETRPPPQQPPPRQPPPQRPPAQQPPPSQPPPEPPHQPQQRRQPPPPPVPDSGARPPAQPANRPPPSAQSGSNADTALPRPAVAPAAAPPTTSPTAASPPAASPTAPAPPSTPLQPAGNAGAAAPAAPAAAAAAGPAMLAAPGAAATLPSASAFPAGRIPLAGMSTGSPVPGMAGVPGGATDGPPPALPSGSAAFKPGSAAAYGGARVVGPAVALGPAGAAPSPGANPMSLPGAGPAQAAGAAAFAGAPAAGGTAAALPGLPAPSAAPALPAASLPAPAMPAAVPDDAGTRPAFERLVAATALLRAGPAAAQLRGVLQPLIDRLAALRLGPGAGRPAGIGPKAAPPPLPPLFAADPPGQRPADPLPSLKDTLTALIQARPALGEQIARQILPQPNAMLGTALLVFLAALRGGDVRGWLGERAARVLEQAGRGEMARLGGEFAALSRQSAEPAGEFRPFLLPVWHDGELEYVQLAVRRPPRDGENGENGEAAGKRFLIEAEMSRTGPLQLDGLVKAKRFHLIVRTRTAFPPAMRSEIRETFGTACEACGLQPSLAFKTSAEGWVRLGEAAGRAGPPRRVDA